MSLRKRDNGGNRGREGKKEREKKEYWKVTEIQGWDDGSQCKNRKQFPRLEKNIHFQSFLLL